MIRKAQTSFIYYLFTFSFYYNIKKLYVQLSDLCEELQEENYQAVTALSRTYQNLTGESVSYDLNDLIALSRWIQENVTKL